MPTYEYECKKCGHNFEVFQSMSDEPLKHCVKCGSEVRRLIFGGAGIIFKGSGFYVTDKAAGRTGGTAAETDKGKKPGGKAGAETKTTQTSSSPTAGDGKMPATDVSKASKDAVASDAGTSKTNPSTQTT
jgi:putative FmdB family regulatory protein